MKFVRKTCLFALISALVFSLAAPAALADDTKAATYSDTANTWYAQDAARYGYSGIFDAGDGLFHGESAVTRMEFARLLHKALDVNVNYFAPVSVSDYFDDVAEGTPGATDLCDLAALGVLASGGSFRPEDPLPRDEMVLWLMNALRYYTNDQYMMIMIALPPYADEADIAEDCLSDVRTASVLGLVLGGEDNRFFPQRDTTRAEAVTVASRLADLLENYNSNVAVNAAASEQDGALTLTLTVLNNTQAPVTLTCPSAQIFDFRLLDTAGNTLWTWSADKSFAAVVTPVVLAPGENVVYSVQVDADTYAALRSRTAQARGYLCGSSDDFTVDSAGYAAE